MFCLLLYCNRLSMRDTPHHVGWLQELIQDVPVGNASHSCGNHIKASCVYMAFNTDSSSNNNDNGYLERLTHVGPKRSHIFKGACVQCTHTRTHAHSHTHTHIHTAVYIRAMELKKRVLKRKGFQGRFKRSDRGSMMDRNKELVPNSWILVAIIIRERALPTVTELCLEGQCSEHLGVCSRAELVGRSVKVENL